jgi:hypothetical protein
MILINREGTPIKIQQTCCCGAKFIGVTDMTYMDCDDSRNEFTFICDKYEAFNRRHCHYHENRLPEKVTGKPFEPDYSLEG